MAYIQPHRNNQWRAQVCKHGARKSKVFKTREEAEEWARILEEKAENAHIRFATEEERLAHNLPLMTAIPTTVLRALQDVPHSWYEIMMASVPTRHSSGIYFLIKRREVIYVGQSVDVLGRIARHRREGRDFDAYTYIECPPEELDQLERQYIRALVPELNMSFGNKDGYKHGGLRSRRQQACDHDSTGTSEE